MFAKYVPNKVHYFSYLLFLFFFRQHSTATTVNIMDLCDNNDEDKCKFCGKGPFKSIRGHHRHSPSCGQQYMIQSQIQASQTSSMVATSPRDGRHLTLATPFLATPRSLSTPASGTTQPTKDAWPKYHRSALWQRKLLHIT